MNTSNQLSVNYVDMTPAQHALWRHELAALFTYVESIELDESDIIADSRIVSPQIDAVALSAN